MTIRGSGSTIASLFVLTILASAQAPLWRAEMPDAEDRRASAPRHLDDPATFTPAFPTRSAWEARAADLRRQVQVSQGLWPMPERPPLAPVVHGRIERDGYTIEKVFFASLPGHYVTGNLYRPTAPGSKRPAVLSPHGHWENGRLTARSRGDAEKDVASGGEKTIESATYPLQARCAMLARLGYVVFMYDMVGYADSGPIRHRDGFTDAQAELRLQSFMGLQTWNSLRALDFLASLPDVDPKRIVVTGESGGGTQTFLVTTLDPRPVAAVPAVMVSGNMQGGCICENASLLRIGTNNIELAALFAPRPQALIGADDWTHDVEKRGLPELKTIYGLFDAADRVDAKHFAFPHNYNQVSREYMYGWFNRWLKLGRPEPIREPPFVPGTPAELAVFDASHPRPADAKDAAALRRDFTQTSDAQLRALAQKPEAFRQTVRDALEVMVVDRFRGEFKVIEPGPAPVQADGFEVRHTLLTRQDGQSRVRTIDIVPAGWAAGPLVVWVDPAGGRAAFIEDGRTLSPLARALVDRRARILVPEVFLTGEAGSSRTRVKNEEKFAGYYYGYNRSPMANRVLDVLTTIAYAARADARELHVIGTGGAGLWALTAKALGGRVVKAAAVDLGGFDFDQITNVDDERLLPGALKYGGVLGIASLCTDGRTTIFGAPAKPAAPWSPRARQVSLIAGAATPTVLIDAVLKETGSGAISQDRLRNEK
jgi:dienelactone hydrolase